MVMFHTYVSLPEGGFRTKSSACWTHPLRGACCAWEPTDGRGIGRLRRKRSVAVVSFWRWKCWRSNVWSHEMGCKNPVFGLGVPGVVGEIETCLVTFPDSYQYLPVQPVLYANKIKLSTTSRNSWTILKLAVIISDIERWLKVSHVFPSHLKLIIGVFIVFFIFFLPQNLSPGLRGPAAGSPPCQGKLHGEFQGAGDG